MAQTKLQQQIASSAKKIQDEQRRLKQLERQQAERDRKDRNHRLCKRHGLIESLLPDTITLTDEQFEAFAKQHIANKHGIAAIATITGQTAEINNTAPTGTKPQNGGGNTSPNTAQSNGKPANPQAVTA